MKTKLLLLPIILLAACDKTDPILQGNRELIFADTTPIAANISVSTLIGKVPEFEIADDAKTLFENAPAAKQSVYSLNEDNILTRNSDKRVIFSGFSTGTKTGKPIAPIINGDYIFIGLSTGEIVKLSKSGDIEWTRDINRSSLLTGGSPLTDVSQMQIIGDYVYASTFGGTTSKLSTDSGEIIWTADTATYQLFLFSGRALFLIDMKNNLSVINTTNGKVVASNPLERKDFENIRIAKIGGTPTAIVNRGNKFQFIPLN
jgi:outer membrane protein assembly factor BamB